ncbi:MAG: hypothetical protein MUC57_16525, partial [Desulfobacterales bacterium]|nr:hypothetical protein [Desulfobacterales bacterium]
RPGRPNVFGRLKGKQGRSTLMLAGQGIFGKDPGVEAFVAGSGPAGGGGRRPPLPACDPATAGMRKGIGMDIQALKNKVCEHIDRRREDMIGIAQRGLALTGVEGTLTGGEAGPTVVVMGELDSVMEKTSPLADPVTGAAHLCGHHIQVASMLGAAMGLVGAGIAPFLSGKVKFLGCPAEEYLEIEYRLGLVAAGKISFLGGKQELIKLGYFDDVDAAMMVHAFADTPEPAFLMNAAGNGFMAKFIRYEGRPSHAGAAPHRGINALNAACIGIMAVHAQRETFQDDDAIRVHPIITKGGDGASPLPASRAH